MTKRSILAAVIFCLGVCISGVAAQAPSIVSASIDRTTNQITISGAHLAPATGAPAVRLDGAALTLVTYSATQIVATVPSGLGAGTFQLRVTVDTLSAAFDVISGDSTNEW